MITEVDDALCVLLGRALPEGTMVRLDPPKPTWQTERPSQAIDLFLFGLRDDPNGRESGWDEVRDERGAVLSRRAPSRRCELSYLVTARSAKVHEEHQLLDTALATLLFADRLPDDCLPESIVASGLPVYLRVATDGPGDLWSSLGMPARAAFVIILSAPFLPAAETDIAKPAEQISLRSEQRKRPTAVPNGLAPAGEKRWRRVPTGGQ